jgi:osmotically-inducible protein OsmY
MKTIRNFSSLLAVAALAVAIAGCAPAEKKQTSGEYIDDVWITSKVKGAFVRKPELSAAAIKIDTYQGEVQLSGYVADAGDVGKAAAVAGGIKGVKSVKNDIQVKK